MDGLATKMICTVIASYLEVYQNTEFKQAQWAGTRDVSPQIHVNAFPG